MVRIDINNLQENLSQIKSDITTAGFMPDLFDDKLWTNLADKLLVKCWERESFKEQRTFVEGVMAKINEFYAQQQKPTEPKKEQPAKPVAPKKPAKKQEATEFYNELNALDTDEQKIEWLYNKWDKYSSPKLEVNGFIITYNSNKNKVSLQYSRNGIELRDSMVITRKTEVGDFLRFVSNFTDRVQELSAKRFEEPKAEPKAEPKKQPSKPAEKKQGESVEMLTPEVEIIQGYIKLHGKSRDGAVITAERLLKKLQKYIITRVIRKTSEYAEDIMTIQEELLKVLNTKNIESVTITNLQHYVDIAQTEHVSKVTNWAKTFVGTYMGRRPEIAKARKFLSKCPDSTELQQAKHALDDYINQRSERVDLTEEALNGICGLAGL